MNEFEDTDIHVLSRRFMTDEDPTHEIKELFVSCMSVVEHQYNNYEYIQHRSENLDYRIFFLNCYSEPARNIICYVS